MRKYLLPVFFTLMMLTSSAAALEFDIFPRTPQKTITGQQVGYTLTIENEQNYADDFMIVVSGPEMGWVKSAYEQIKIQPGEVKKLPFVILPSGENRGEFIYNITVNSVRYHDYSVKRNATIYVRYPFSINTLKAQKVDGQLELILDLESIGQQSSPISFQIRNSDGIVVSDFIIQEEVNESKRIIRYVPFDAFFAGDYVVLASIPGTSLYKEAPFTVEAVRSLVETKKVTSNPFYTVVEVQIENRGNVVEKGVEYYQDVSSDTFTGFVTRPDNCVEEGDGAKCKYVINEIRPGMTANIVYRVDLWPLLGAYALGIMGLAGSVGIGYKKFTSPKLSKKALKKSASEHVVYLEIKNNFKKKIDNIVVRDWVSPLASVVNDFETLKPVMRKSDAGTELIWKLENVRKNDYRVISYKIRTVVNGEIKMPRAYIRYNNKNGQRGRVYSNPLILK